jgi:ribosomal-protein-alanine N-acetyltransferase
MTIGNRADPSVSLSLLSYETMLAMLAGDLSRASALSGIDLPPYFLTHDWLWKYRTHQIERFPDSAPWLVRAVVSEPERVVVGHAGFHGPPDGTGMVEVGYTILPEFRRRGFGRAAVRELIRYASSDARVRVVRASISPDNTPSLALVTSLDFSHVGEQWDDEDGQELIYELSLVGATDVPDSGQNVRHLDWENG